MTIKKQIAIVSVVVAAIVVGLVAGFSWGYARGGAAVTASYAPKIAQVQALFPMPAAVSSLTGQVEGISGTTLTLKAASVTPDPFAGGFPAVRSVTITSSTKMTQDEQKNPAEFQKEMQDYMKQMADIATSGQPTAIAPPVPFSESDIALSDIAVGDTVTVTASSDILDAPSFTATAIQKQATP